MFFDVFAFSLSKVYMSVWTTVYWNAASRKWYAYTSKKALREVGIIVLLGLMRAISGNIFKTFHCNQVMRKQEKSRG